MNNSLDLRSLTQIANEFVQQYKSNLLDAGKSASGNLVNSAKAYVDWNGTVLSISMELPDYWKYVEYGRKPGKFPPLDKIRQWIKVKPVLPHPGKNGKIPSENTLAYLLARKIATKGIKGTHTLEDTIDKFQLVKKVTDTLTRLMTKNLEDSLGKNRTFS